MNLLSERSPGGFALPSAVFLLVILSLLAAFIVQVATRQQVGHAADVRGSRAEARGDELTA